MAHIDADPRNVFISSTSRDLAKFRVIAQRIAKSLHFTRIVMEDFEAGGRNPPLEQCLRRIREEADVLIVIVAKRYGWVPSDEWDNLPPEQVRKSITWLECIEARKKGIDIIPLVLDENARWSRDLTEEQRSSELDEFRKWLDHLYVAKRFRTTDQFRDELTSALDKWKNGGNSTDDPAQYFEWIFSKAEITLGMPGQRASVHLPYVPLKAHQSGNERDLEAFLIEPYLLVTGGPGMGKSTFLAKHAADLAHNFGKIATSRFPVLLPAGEFWNHVISFPQRFERGSPTAADSPRWISHFLATASVQRGWALSGDFFERQLQNGKCTILIDGFDDADRHQMGTWLEQTKRLYPGCRIVIASRPWATLETRGLEQFARISIAALNNSTIKRFLLNWSTTAISRLDEGQRHAQELHRGLIARPTLRRFARTPLLLTIIARDWQDPDDLPLSRSAIYEKITGHLLDAAPNQANKPLPYEPIEAIQELAWAMQSSSTRKTEVTARWAAGRVVHVMGGLSVVATEKHLQQLAAKTGILVADGDRLRFWHPTLQEFLAARRLAYTPGDERLRNLTIDLLVSEPWRQVLLFLGQLLEPEPDDLDVLLKHLLDSFKNASAWGVRMRHAAAIFALNRELSHFPDSLGTAYGEVLEAMQIAFSSGDLKEVDLSSRIEIARFIGSRAVNSEIVWVDIPAGEFWMGAQKDNPSQPRFDQNAFLNEAPVRRVALEPYQIGKFPVTVESYAAFIRDDGYRNPDLWRAGGYQQWVKPLRWEEQLDISNQPVTGVSWYEAAAFCSWARCRLPTEAEWERAAAGTGGRRFPWGDMVPNGACANYDRIFGGVTPVGLFPEHTSAEQVHDLAGNVWEWVLDEYDHKPGRSRKTLRGGSHQNDWRFLRTSERIAAAPNARYTNFGQTGFRCARDLSSLRADLSKT